MTPIAKFKKQQVVQDQFFHTLMDLAKAKEATLREEYTVSNVKDIVIAYMADIFASSISQNMTKKQQAEILNGINYRISLNSPKSLVKLTHE